MFTHYRFAGSLAGRTGLICRVRCGAYCYKRRRISRHQSGDFFHDTNEYLFACFYCHRGLRSCKRGAGQEEESTCKQTHWRLRFFCGNINHFPGSAKCFVDVAACPGIFYAQDRSLFDIFIQVRNRFLKSAALIIVFPQREV